MRELASIPVHIGKLAARIGKFPESRFVTGTGPDRARRLRVRARGAGKWGGRARLTSAIAPLGARRARRPKALPPGHPPRGTIVGVAASPFGHSDAIVRRRKGHGDSAFSYGRPRE